jgi:Uma2 family endonuclease
MATSHTILRLGQRDQGRPVSADEFANAEFDEPWRYERVGGRLVVMAPAGEDHIQISEPLRDYLGAYRLSHPEVVRRVASEAWIEIDADHDRVADIAVYLEASNQTGPIPVRVPDLSFEIVTPGRRNQHRDYVERRAEYARRGVREYVIVDRTQAHVLILTLAGREYTEQTLCRGDTYTSPHLPDLAIPLAEILPPESTTESR